NVIELFVAGLAQVARHAGIERLRDAQRLRGNRHLQAQIVKRAPLQAFTNRAVSANRFARRAVCDEDYRAEIEAVADAARLIINQRVIVQAIAGVVTKVRIDERRAGVGGGLRVTLNRAQTEFDLFARQDDQQVIAGRRREQRVDAAPACEVASDDSRLRIE